MDQRVQEYLLKLTDEKRALVLQLREIILSVDKSICEAIKWNNLTFYVNKYNFLFIYTYKQVDYVNLGFFFATKLSDPNKLFEGTGQTMRHIKVKNTSDIPAAEIKKWVKESLMLEEASIKKLAVKKAAGKKEKIKL